VNKITLWVDGDACPTQVKQILFRASERTQTKLVLVANHLSKIPASPYISIIVVASGIDEADKYITAHAKPGDLVITADIPLATHVVNKGCYALNPRGQLYTESNIKQQLAVRNLMADLRSQMLISGGPASYSKTDSQVFARELDKILTKLKNNNE
jgi:uncharacterized protein YaiI (UPF0178 family)